MEKLPAFNWTVDTGKLEVQERRHEEAREQSKWKYQTIPGLKSRPRTVQDRTIQPEKQKEDESRASRRRASVLVLQGCSKTLEESDFYRVGPKGNHLESWTSGILKGMLSGCQAVGCSANMQQLFLPATISHSNLSASTSSSSRALQLHDYT